MTPNIIGCLTYIEMFRQSLLAVLTYLASAITTNRLLLKMKWIVVWKPKCNFLFLHRRIKPKLNGLKRCHQIPEEQWDINDRFLLENYWCHLRLHHRRYHYLHPPENAKKEHVMFCTDSTHCQLTVTLRNMRNICCFCQLNEEFKEAVLVSKYFFFLFRIPIISDIII